MTLIIYQIIYIVCCVGIVLSQIWYRKVSKELWDTQNKIISSLIQDSFMMKKDIAKLKSIIAAQHYERHFVEKETLDD